MKNAGGQIESKVETKYRCVWIVSTHHHAAISMAMNFIGDVDGAAAIFCNRICACFLGLQGPYCVVVFWMCAQLFCSKRCGWCHGCSAASCIQPRTRQDRSEARGLTIKIQFGRACSRGATRGLRQNVAQRVAWTELGAVKGSLCGGLALDRPLNGHLERIGWGPVAPEKRMISLPGLFLGRSAYGVEGVEMLMESFDDNRKSLITASSPNTSTSTRAVTSTHDSTTFVSRAGAVTSSHNSDYLSVLFIHSSTRPRHASIPRPDPCLCLDATLTPPFRSWTLFVFPGAVW